MRDPLLGRHAHALAGRMLFVAGALSFGCSSSPSTPPADAGPVDAGASDAGSAHLDLPLGEWHWFDIPRTQCGTGEETGLAVNLGTSKDLVFYLEGGGLCWDEQSCDSLSYYVKSGYKEAQFRQDLAQKGSIALPIHDSIFDRNLTSNPFKDSSFVFVPYCTGDLHSGDAVQDWPKAGTQMHYAGARNLVLDLDFARTHFGDASHVTLAGRSAGAFGGQINYWRVKEAFGNTRVDLVADSGPMIKNIGLITLGAPAWQIYSSFPPGCPSCVNDYSALYSYYATTYPTARFATISYDRDAEVAVGSLTDVETFHANLQALLENTITPLSNSRYFVVPGTKHVVMTNFAAKPSEADAPMLATWLGQMVSDDPAWASAGP